MGHQQKHFRKFRTKWRWQTRPKRAKKMMQHPFRVAARFVVYIPLFFWALGLISDKSFNTKDSADLIFIGLAIGPPLGFLVTGMALAQWHIKPKLIHQKIKVFYLLVYGVGAPILILGFILILIENTTQLNILSATGFDYSRWIFYAFITTSVISLLILFEIAFSGWCAHFRNQASQSES